MRRYLWRILVALLVVVLAASAAYASSLVIAFSSYLRYIYAVIALVGGIAIARELSVAVTDILRPRLHKNSLIVGNVVSVSGFIFSAFLAASFAAISSTTILASAAFGGLVLGLALQPTLGSFFAGLFDPWVRHSPSGDAGKDSQLAHPVPGRALACVQVLLA